MSDRSEQLRKLPKIDELLKLDSIKNIEAPRAIVLSVLREQVATLRENIQNGSDVTDLDVSETKRAVQTKWKPSIRKVLNGTGVMLHTNLGRAPLFEIALQESNALAKGYCSLEYDVKRGKRGSRHNHASGWLTMLTGAEDAVVVNNCAAAVLLALAACGSKKEVVVSRGELIEIGGSFRVPEVMDMSGVRLHEIGTTNKTKISDYENAIHDGTGMLAKIHRSNFDMVGFIEDTPMKDIGKVAKKNNIPFMVDLGSGVLASKALATRMGLGMEPTIQDALDAGASIVCFSGDKILGGPQAGILVGTKAWIDKCRHHPLMRALRPDKLVLSVLETTLRNYIENEGQDLPVMKMLNTPAEKLKNMAEEWSKKAADFLGLQVTPVALKSKMGGGTLPTVTFESYGVELGGASATQLDKWLRGGDLPVVGRIVDGAYCLDLRTLILEGHLDACWDELKRIDATWLTEKGDPS